MTSPNPFDTAQDFSARQTASGLPRHLPGSVNSGIAATNANTGGLPNVTALGLREFGAM
jgi:hypothetical protein